MSKVATVVGANGFVGFAVCKELLDHGYSINAVVNSNIVDRFHSPNVNYHRFDEFISDKKLAEGSDYLFNFAWSGLKGPLMSDYEVQLSNIRNTVDLIRCCAETQCKYIQAASIIEHEAYNNIFKTDNATGNTHVYGAAKFMAHVLTKHFAAIHGVNYSCGLITNAYGPYERNPRLITNTIRKILSGETPIFSSGNQLYDFVYVSDVATAFRLIAERGSCKSYVIGSGNPLPLKTYLRTINSLIAPEMNFVYGGANVSVDYLEPSCFSISELSADTGFEPSVSFEEGIMNTFNCLKQSSISP